MAVSLLTVGRSATHTVAFAQLYIHGKCYGVHPFIVQIRSLQDHSLCPGKHFQTLLHPSGNIIHAGEAELNMPFP